MSSSSSSSVTILLPAALRAYAGGAAAVGVEAATVGDALRELSRRHPELDKHLRAPDGKLRSFVNVYVGDEDVRFLDGDATPLAAGVELSIVPSIAGGAATEAAEATDAAEATEAAGATVAAETAEAAEAAAPPAGIRALPELTRDEVGRYSRHLLLDEVGLEGQRRLKAASVLCVGTGGLGAPLLLYLAAAGIGRIGICDFDVVEESNLQRQVIHGTASLGKPKVLSAKQRLHDINPHVEVVVHEERLTSENALRILAPYDVVVDGTDNFPTRYLVNDACVLLDKPNVYGSIFRFEGQASVFNYRGGPNYRDLYPEPPPPGLVPSCADGGVLGILPALIGSIQATETVKIVLGLGETLSGRLLLYDALRMRFRELKVRKLPDAARPKIERLIDYEEFCGIPRRGQETAPDMAEQEAGGAYTNLTVKEVKERLDTGWEPYVLDVRGPREVEIAQTSIVDRVQPHTQVLAIADDIPKDRDVLVYCKAGGRSRMACLALASAGHERLFNMDGGITAWAREVDPSIPVY